uniref:Uncharacterized protein n=1 Tax=Rhizophora mucronata TaxID=61149 RepID=A0A2P2NKV2_RHIMU
MLHMMMFSREEGSVICTCLIVIHVATFGNMFMIL